MFVRVTKSPTAKFSKVYLVEGYRDENGKSKQRIVKCYGNLEELEAKDPDILIKLKAQAKKIPKNAVNITLNLSDANSEMESDQNYGYFFLEHLYNELEIPEFLNKYPFISKHEFDLNKILQLLVYGRILNPCSKKATVEHQEEYFEPFQLTLDSVYSALSKLDEIKDDLQGHLNLKIYENYGRDASVVFYDVTNYYFETDREDDLKKVGMSKENKKTPIVQMGLLIDKNGLPIAYNLFPGNVHDSTTMIPFIEKMRAKYKLGKIILTADKGLNSGKNLAYLTDNQDGYIVSQKVRGASKAFLQVILAEEGYSYNNSKTFKLKSFIQERSVKNEVGDNVLLKEKVVCFWSKDYDVREKKKREKLDVKIQEFLDSPSKYKASNRYGVKKYLTLQDLDKKTGEIKDVEPFIDFNQEKYDRDVSLDGYYALVTSELEMSEEEIIQKYRNLWKIEESFRVMKSDLEGRPVYVRKNDHVEGHFLVCFIALLIGRILENKLKGQVSIRKIQESLRSATCRNIDNGIYSLNKQDDVYREIEKAFDVSLNYKNVRIEQLRSYKRDVVHNI